MNSSGKTTIHRDGNILAIVKKIEADNNMKSIR